MKEPEVLVYMWNKHTGKFDIPVTMEQIIALRERKRSSQTWYKAVLADSASDVEFFPAPPVLEAAGAEDSVPGRGPAWKKSMIKEDV